MCGGVCPGSQNRCFSVLQIAGDSAILRYFPRVSGMDGLWYARGGMRGCKQSTHESMKFLGVFAILVSILSAQAGTNVLVSTGSFWTYLDNGSNQGTNWARPGFNDGLWNQGQAPFGYGGNVSELNTVVSFGPNANAKFITTYFRQTIELGNPEIYTILRLNVKR